MIIKNKHSDNIALKIIMQEKSLAEYFNIKEYLK